MRSDSPDAMQGLLAITGFRLTTNDLPGLRRFYMAVLGFAADGPEQPIAPQELRLLGLTGTGRRQTLRLGQETVAIDQFDPPGRPYPGGNAASPWFQHLALVVPDMAEAYRRLEGVVPISVGGPQQLPASSGGVSAFKFRDPDGHPLELLAFPAGAVPAAWAGKSTTGAQIGLGIDHSAISIADVASSAAFYAGLGLRAGDRTTNLGIEQQQLDGLPDVRVAVVPMLPSPSTPHLELLGYAVPTPGRGKQMQPNDVAATRIVWNGERAALLRDPDGHLHQVEAGR